jgi:hypothetical protein
MELTALLLKKLVVLMLWLETVLLLALLLLVTVLLLALLVQKLLVPKLAQSDQKCLSAYLQASPLATRDELIL